MLGKIKNALIALHRDERGAMSVETILILALIALPLLIILAMFRTTIVGWFGKQSGSLNNQEQQLQSQQQGN